MGGLSNIRCMEVVMVRDVPEVVIFKGHQEVEESVTGNLENVQEIPFLEFLANMKLEP